MADDIHSKPQAPDACRRPPPRPPPQPADRARKGRPRSCRPAALAGRVYAYARVSNDAQAEDGQSLEVQRRQLEGWAMQRGTPLDAVHVEAGVSGATPFHERPEGGKLWGELRKDDVLVASKLDRMFRSASDCLNVVEVFKARGVSLYLLDLNDGADDVSGNGIARLFLTIVAAFERDRIGERIRATKRQQKARGEYLGGPPPFGWSHDAEKRLVPIPDQQKILRLIHKLAADGVSPRRISADIAERGVTLSHVTVGKIIAGRRATAPGSAPVMSGRAARGNGGRRGADLPAGIRTGCFLHRQRPVDSMLRRQQRLRGRPLSGLRGGD